MQQLSRSLEVELGPDTVRTGAKGGVSAPTIVSLIHIGCLVMTSKGGFGDTNWAA